MDEQYIDNYYYTLFANRARIQDDENFVRELLASHLSYVPQKLYKYRECNKNNFDVLAKRQIYVPYADAFHDPFDYTLKLDIEAQKKQILQYYTSREIVTAIVFQGIEKAFVKLHVPSNISLKDVEYIYDHFVTSDGRCLKKKFEVTIVNKLPQKEQKKYQIILEQIESYLIKQVSHIKENCEEIAKKAYEQCQKPRKETRIYCLSEKKDCGPMWEHYTDNYSGYCIEYDFSSWETIPAKELFRLLNILPVTYSEKRAPFDLEPFFPLATKQLLLGKSPTEAERLPIEIKIMKHFMIKQADYSYEKEWRLLLLDHKDPIMPFPFVSAIYLGRNISQDNESSLCKIASQLEVPVFKQKMSYFGNELRFEEIKR